MGASTILARLAAGNIIAATGAQANTLIGAFTKIVPQVFLTAGITNYTPSSNMIFNLCLGIGSGGSGGSSTTGGFAGGGGAGEQRFGCFSAAQISGGQTVTIAAAVSGNASGDNDGKNGNSTSLGSLLVSNGGSFGHKGSVAQGGLGGTGGTGGIGIPGQQGQAGSNPAATPGIGGNSLFGSSGNLQFAAASPAMTAVGYGAGGTGAYGTTAGANSAPGLMIIFDFCSV